MESLKHETICGIATPVGEGGIGIIKISGPDALPIAGKLFRARHSRFFGQTHRLHHGWIKNPATGDTVDEVLVSFMAAPNTYTREDVVEINCHSGYAALNCVLQLILAEGARLAEPGEFTRRAFMNGRIDLTQAEAIADIIHARSRESLLLANRNLEGGLRTHVQSWQEILLDFHSQLEAHMDFAEDLDEDDPDVHTLVSVLETKLLHPLALALNDFDTARLIREGLTLVLVGKPNTGKSSLLNALLGKDRAIVTPWPGTTRDVIEDSFMLSGVQVRILDTAGIREQPDEIELIGIERTIRSVEEADVVLWLVDRSRPLSNEDQSVFRAISSRPYIILLNKVDLPAVVTATEVRNRFTPGAEILSLSVFDPVRIELLRDYLAKTYLHRPIEMSRSLIITNLRQSELLRQTIMALQRAKGLLMEGAYSELVSLEIGLARRHLDSVVGGEENGDLLDRIFSRFCVGK